MEFQDFLWERLLEIMSKNWRLMRENLYQDINTGDLKWKRVKINGKKR